MTKNLLCSRRMASIALGRSERTVRRWDEDGVLKTVAHDASGRAMVGIAEVFTLLNQDMNLEMAELIVQADGGSAEAQSDLGMELLQNGRATGAFELFRESVEQGYPEAMHWLYQCYMKGLGVERDENLAMMWLNKAAAHGHAIAKAQADAIRALALQRLQASGPTAPQ
ncbi:tetratricopeptide repeat protein [Thiomonas sp. X19]|uniref:tetratricopeptide repeat protein n=1 Tax=Thiomonas sp. X19 TaxID=1050370 RepID=UPI001E49E9E5|nr:sel1 repeat family protein [Thiomonas sp. X19]